MVKKELVTEDSFFNGKIKLLQHQDGYRFSIDSVLLAAFVKPGHEDRIVDLGTGCGIISLILGYRYPGVKITGIEVQHELAELAARNVEINGLNERISIICNDLKKITINEVSGPVDIVVSNPPYRKEKSGRVNPNYQQAVARHEIMSTIDDVVKAGSRLLGVGGRFAVIYTAERIADLLISLRSSGIEPKSLQTVHSKPNDPARLILVSGIKGSRPGTTIMEPLFIYQTDGSYTKKIMAMFSQ